MKIHLKNYTKVISAETYDRGKRAPRAREPVFFTEIMDLGQTSFPSGFQCPPSFNEGFCSMVKIYTHHQSSVALRVLKLFNKITLKLLE